MIVLWINRIQKFQREKAEREARLAEEQRLEMMQKEREKNRIAEQALQANLVSVSRINNAIRIYDHKISNY